MGSKKLLQRLAELFDLDAKEKAQHREDMEDVLRRLKQREEELKNKLEKEIDEHESRKLQQKIDLVHGQIKKGVTTLLELDNKTPE